MTDSTLKSNEEKIIVRNRLHPMQELQPVQFTAGKHDWFVFEKNGQLIIQLVSNNREHKVTIVCASIDESPLAIKVKTTMNSETIVKEVI